VDLQVCKDLLALLNQRLRDVNCMAVGSVQV